MRPRDALLENPFAVLGASPRDSRTRLIELADDAALFGDATANDRVNRLLQPGSRLEAEMGWFPSTDAVEVAKVLDYAREDRAAPVPSLQTNSALARFNACRLFLSYWPVADAEDAMALCESLVILERPVKPEHTVREIQSDRKAAGMPGEIDGAVVANRLETQRNEAAQLAVEACSPLNARERAVVYLRLAKRYGSDEPLYHFNPFVARMVEAYALTIEGDVQCCANKVNDLLRYFSSKNITRSRAIDLGSPLEKQVGQWVMLSGPMLALQAARKVVPKASADFMRAIMNGVNQVINRLCQADKQNSQSQKLYEVCASILSTSLPATAGIDSLRRQVEALLAQIDNDQRML